MESIYRLCFDWAYDHQRADLDTSEAYAAWYVAEYGDDMDNAPSHRFAFSLFDGSRTV